MTAACRKNNEPAITSTRILLLYPFLPASLSMSFFSEEKKNSSNVS